MKPIEIPGYKIIRELGHGGMATVYLALHKRLDREVALKVMAPVLAADASFGERFAREAKIVAKLSHQNIIGVFDVGVSGEHHYIAMEFHSGGELKDKLVNGLQPKIAVHIMKQIASALNFAHQQGYIHRDIKPENILFSKDNNSILTDFGIARAESSSTQMTQIGSVIGTPSYMSPEQSQGKKLDGRADLYSLGVVFYEMLTGKPPYDGDSGVSIAIKHMTEDVPRLPENLSEYQGFLEKAMAKKADDRFQSGQQIIDALDQLVSGVVVPPVKSKTEMWTPSATQVAKIEGQTSGGRKWVLSGVVLVVIAGVSVFFMLGQNADPVIAPEPVADASTNQSDRSTNALQQKITSLLKDAESAFEDNRLISPRGNNAQEYYQAVLLLDNNNGIANKGLLNLSEEYVQKAEKAIEVKKLSDAQSYIIQATELYSENTSIARLNDSLRSAKRLIGEEDRARLEKEKKLAAIEQKNREQLAEKKRIKQKVRKASAQRSEKFFRLAALQKKKREEERKNIERQKRDAEIKLSELVGKADGYLESASLTSSRISRAQRLYQEAKQLSPNDSRLKAVPEKVAKAYSILAEEKISDKEFNSAGELILQGLELDPGNKKLIALQQTINSSQKKKRRTFGGF